MAEQSQSRNEPLSDDDRYWLEKLIADVESPEQRPYIQGFSPMRLAFMARMLRRALTPLSEQRTISDTARMDWLEHQDVIVRTPLVHGSRMDFIATPEDLDGDEGPSDIRRAIDARIKDVTIEPQPAERKDS